MNTTIQNTTKYKNSPLGMIPEDWEVKLFSDVFDYVNTPSFSRDNLTNLKTEKEVKYIHYGDIHSAYKSEMLDVESETIPYLKDEFVNEIKLNFLKEGDLVIADASEDYLGIGECIELKNVGKTKIIGGLHTIVARSKENQTFNGFRTYIFNSFLVSKSLKTIATGISVFGISKGNLSKLKLPIPPLPEQKAIADCLSTWDQAIEKQNALIAQKELSKKALMQQLLSGKKRLKGFSGNNDFHVIGRYIKEISERNKDLKVTRVLSVTNSRGFINQSEQFDRVVASDDASNYKIVRKGQFAYNPSRVNVGSLDLLKNFEEGILSPMYVVFETIPTKLNSNFLYYHLKSFWFSGHISMFVQGSVRDSLAFDGLSGMKFFIPSIEEQIAIANILQCADEELQLLKKKLAQLKEQKKGLMQVLLTGRKRL